MVEVQHHGFSFERWVRNNLFESYEGNYMQKWDVPPDYNTHEAIPEGLQNIPVSIKTAKYGSPIGLGDALRQRNIEEPFLMVAGFWRQRSSAEKWFEDIGYAKFSRESWNSLWGNLSLRQLAELDELVKDMTTHYSAARAKALAWKLEVATNSGCKLVINPKIDSKTQRRVQCSLPFSTFWQYAGRTPTVTDFPKLFGYAFDNPVLSTPRIFNPGRVQDGKE